MQEDSSFLILTTGGQYRISVQSVFYIKTRIKIYVETVYLYIPIS
jgi:hypothetical protein